jgi:hypothetical protein
MIFIGVVGEYIGTIHTLVQKRPLVVEEQRVNFEYRPGEPRPNRAEFVREGSASE